MFKLTNLKQDGKIALSQLSFFLVLTALAGVGILTYREAQSLRVQIARVIELDEIDHSIQQIDAWRSDGQQAVAKFTMTGKRRHLEPYFAAQKLLAQELAGAKVRMEADPELKQALVELDDGLAREARIDEQKIQARELDGLNAVIQIVLQPESDEAQARIDVAADAMRDKASLKVRHGLENARYRSETSVVIVCSVLVMILLLSLFAAWVVRRHIEEQRDQARVLTRMREAALEASRAKSDFLANMSHEIRTPLNAVIGLTDLLLSTELTPDQFDHLRTIQSSSGALLALLNDILDFSKIEAGKIEIEELAIEPAAVVGGIRGLFEEAARQQGVDLGVQVALEVPARVGGDPLRLRQVLTNLVGNAIKFTAGAPGSRKRQVRVRVAAEAGEKGPALRFEVQDTGVGIPADRQDRIFGEFSQADESITRKFGGTGLGLAISKRLVELMGGEIGFRSQEGEGTCFWFRLPLKPAPLAQAARPAQADAGPLDPAARGARLILVAEDNAVNRKVCLGMLERAGYRAQAVTNGREALEALGRTAYDLVLMDHQMPELDGLEATRRLRAGAVPGRESLPVIALTANAYEEQRAECARAGMNDFVAKPIDSAELERVVDRWIRPAAPVADAPVPAAEASVDAAVIASLAKLQEQLGDGGFLSGLVQTYFKESGEHLGKLARAVERGDVESVRFESHALKSNCGNLGVRKLFGLCDTLERMAAGPVQGSSLPLMKALLAELSLEHRKSSGELQVMVIGGQRK